MKNATISTGCYGVIFQVGAGMVRIIAVAHLHRQPDYWKDRV
jgi:hypothetical protein